jgi:glycosyltransferase involved in cell wall biosynthesis
MDSATKVTTMQSAPGPLVSIMIPTYNQDRFLVDAVESALAQDFPSLEVVVADDCSTDGTADLVTQWLGDPRFRYVRHAHNIGRVANSRALLYELVRGQWTLNLDGDDYLCDPTFISRAIAALRDCQDAALAFSSVHEVIGGKRFAGILQHHPPLLDGTEVVRGYASIYESKRGRSVVFIPHAAAVYHVALARAMDFYRTDILSADLESLLRLIVGRKVVFVEGPVACWRHHGANATAKTSATVMLRNFELVEGVYRHLRDHGIWSSSLRHAWRARMARAKFINDAQQLLATGQGAALADFYRRACRQYPGLRRCALSPALLRAIAAAVAKRALRRQPAQNGRAEEAGSRS